MQVYYHMLLRAKGPCRSYLPIASYPLSPGDVGMNGR